MFSVAKNFILKAGKSESSQSTQASTGIMIEGEKRQELKGSWINKIFSMEHAVQTFSLDKTEKQDCLLSFDEGNDRLIIVN